MRIIWEHLIRSYSTVRVYYSNPFNISHWWGLICTTNVSIIDWIYCSFLIFFLFALHMLHLRLNFEWKCSLHEHFLKLCVRTIADQNLKYVVNVKQSNWGTYLNFFKYWTYCSLIICFILKYCIRSSFLILFICS